MNICPGEGVAYDSYYNETDRVKYAISLVCLIRLPAQPARRSREFRQTQLLSPHSWAMSM